MTHFDLKKLVALGCLLLPSLSGWAYESKTTTETRLVFSNVCDSGQTLYYEFMGGDSVRITFPGDTAIHDVEEDYFYYGFEKPYGLLKIPNMIDYDGRSYRVVEIGPQAFSGCDKLSQIELSDQIRTIGFASFDKCTGLDSVEIPSNVLLIDKYAFSNCENIIKVKITGKETIIEEGAFNPCESLSSFEYSSSKLSENWVLGYSNVKTVIFNGTLRDWVEEGCRLLAYNGLLHPTSIFIQGTDIKSISTIEVPEGTKSIESHAFSDFPLLDTLIIPESVDTIGWFLAGRQSSSITKLQLPSSAINIPYGVFDAHAVPNLKEIVCSYDVYNKFFGGRGIASVKITEAPDTIVVDCNSISGYTGEFLSIPENVTSLTVAIKQKSKDYYDYKHTLGYKTLAYNGSFENWCENPVKLFSELLDYGEPSFESYPLHLIVDSLDLCTVTSLKVPQGIQYLGENVFNPSTNLKDIKLPSSLEIIPNNAFQKCNNLRKITCMSSTPPDINDEDFSNFVVNPDSVILYVKSGSVDKYKEHKVWGTLFKNIKIAGEEVCTKDSLICDLVDSSSYTSSYAILKSILTSQSDFILPQTIEWKGVSYCVKSIDEEFFTNPTLKKIHVSDLRQWAEIACSTKIDSTIEIYYNGTILSDQVDTVIKEFVGSSSTASNVTVSSDSLEYIHSSVNALLQRDWWNEEVETLHITNGGDVIPAGICADAVALSSLIVDDGINTIPNGAFKGCSSLTSVSLGNDVRVIEDYAFESCIVLPKITLPQNVQSIGASAFGKCSRLRYVTNYAVYPPEANESAFYSYNGYLYMPCDYFDEYDMHECWGNFKHVECLKAETSNVTDIEVNPNFVDAEFAWPASDDAETYSLEIIRDGGVLCTLNFNAEGQLVNIDFSTKPSSNIAYDPDSSVYTRSASLRSAQLRATTASTGYKFTVTGLSEGTSYGFSLEALDQDDDVIKSYNGNFKTKSTRMSEEEEEDNQTTEVVDNEQNDILCVSSDGVLTIQADANARVSIYNTQGQCLQVAVGSATFQAPSVGVYLVVCGNQAFKVLVK